MVITHAPQCDACAGSRWCPQFARADLDNIIIFCQLPIANRRGQRHLATSLRHKTRSLARSGYLCWNFHRFRPAGEVTASTQKMLCTLKAIYMLFFLMGTFCGRRNMEERTFTPRVRANGLAIWQRPRQHISPRARG